MTRKHPSSEQIQGMLREGHFGQSRALPAADPLTTTQMLLEIDRIKTYDRNPRKERNPLYDEIRASIRAQGGLNNPLTVTRRPGDELYTVESGGNTRLQILHELWTETRDSCFYRIHCLFRPWVSESHVLTAHLIENDKRGALTFIDKALGVRELRDVLESEGQEKFSQRQLVEALKERGYGLDQSMISRMEYAVDVLLPLIPAALRGGMGAPQIRRIRRLETACRDLWTEQGQVSERFSALFSDEFADHDDPAWDLDTVQQALETRLAESLQLPLKHVRLEIDTRLVAGIEEHSSEGATVGNENTATHKKPPADTPPPSAVVPDSRTPSLHADPGQPDRYTRETTSSARPPHEGPSDLKSLRSRCYVLALKIAQRHDLEDCLLTAGHLGMGFLIDLPHNPIIPVAGQADALQQLARQWIWWLLLSLSEEAVHPERLEAAPTEVVLRTLILEGNDTKALNLVGEPDWKALGYELISNPLIPDSTIDDLLALAQTCRQLRRSFDNEEDSGLWRRNAAS
ncbi:MAG: hypothetical protein IT488_00265 [Gammaproteobacteria bacterium]|nr:hypothetical protein [Gammaproteobacteria bacterium]